MISKQKPYYCVLKPTGPERPVGIGGTILYLGLISCRVLFYQNLSFIPVIGVIISNDSLFLIWRIRLDPKKTAVKLKKFV